MLAGRRFFADGLLGGGDVGPSAWVAALLALGCAALLATWVPTHRATRVDPVRAIQSE